MTAPFINALRINHALTAVPEKRLLLWLAQRLPAAINSDHLTALAFASQLGAGAAYALSRRQPGALWLVNFFLLLNWFGDSLDGTVARVRNQQRPRYGFYVDHIADTFGAAAMMAGLGLSGYAHWPVAAGMLVCFYLVSIQSFLATYTLGRFHLSEGVFGPTEIRILLAIGNAVLLAHPYSRIAGHTFLLFDVGGAVAMTGMTLFTLRAAVRHTRQLYKEEAIR